MKRKILTLIFAIAVVFAYSQTNFVTISGYVTKASNGSPIQNQAVYIYADSAQFHPLFNYYGQVYTNANGFYIDTIPVTNQGTVYTQGGFVVSTYNNCNNTYLSSSVSFNPNSYFLQANFVVCDSIPVQACQASFYAYRDSSNNHMFYFEDYSSGNPTNWYWNFGDSTTGTGQYPTHTYLANGFYNVCLTISGDSCQSTYCSDVTVGNDTTNTGCHASFYAYSDSSINQRTYYFVNTSDTIGMSYFWSFGDGTSSYIRNPEHTFPSSGTYDVCLTISGNSCQNSFCTVVAIGQDTTVTGCQAYFYAFPDSSANQLTYYFDDYSTGNPANWYWSFGDGTTGTGQYPMHTYSSKGSYDVCLTISGDSCQSSYCSYITVGGDTTYYGCQAYFYTYSDSLNGSNYSTIDFADASSGSPISWNWSFGDGTSSTVQYPTHTFNPGQYYVCLAITTASGCASSYCDYVYVYNNDSTYCNLYCTSSVTNETSTGAANGTATVTPIGGTSPYLYGWSNGATTQTISGLTQGYYNVNVTDSKGCQTWTSVEILTQSDSTNWNNYDTLNTNPIDTCLNFPIGNASIYSYSIINSNTIAITWIVYSAQGASHSFISVEYTFGSNGNYQVPLVITCDSVRTTYNFYGPIHIMQPSGIIDYNSSSVNLTLYPNPVTDQLNIGLNSSLSGQVKVSVLNLVGQVIQTNEIVNVSSQKVITVNTASLPKGLYFVQLNCEGQIVTGRFVK